MMEVDYQVGSLSELITGEKVSKKHKVLQQKLKRPKNEEHVDESSENLLNGTSSSTINTINENSDDGLDLSILKKKKKVKKKVTDSEHTELSASAEKELPNRRKEKKDKIKKIRAKEEEKKELRENSEDTVRTIFVGNVPLTTKKERLSRFFMKYGKVESVRFRGAPVNNINTPKKVAIIKNDFHPDRKSFISYVKFETEADAKNALAANGEMFKDHHIRVSMCRSEEKPDESKAIFIGNLPLKAEDEQLWNTFESCGKISSVRIVRDKKTGMGKGFAFVNFANSDSVQLALELEDVKMDNNVLRIKPCNAKAAQKNKKKNISKVIKPKKSKKISVRNGNFNEKAEKRKRGDIDEGSKEVKRKKKMNEMSEEPALEEELTIRKKSKNKFEKSISTITDDHNGAEVRMKGKFKKHKQSELEAQSNIGKSGPMVTDHSFEETKDEMKKKVKKHKQSDSGAKSDYINEDDVAKKKNKFKTDHSFEGTKIEMKKKKKKNLGLAKKLKLVKKIAPKS